MCHLLVLVYQKMQVEDALQAFRTEGATFKATLASFNALLGAGRGAVSLELKNRLKEQVRNATVWKQRQDDTLAELLRKVKYLEATAVRGEAKTSFSRQRFSFLP